ncbi:DUF1205 domain-containing protein [Actinomadura viridis]|uniref:L-2-deoxyfucosyltransferase n=1 Tax=Actinomadura viridis TaxID=58110 RepID=A0A931DM65_9ACTN|nr:activator-dependent family glycosyltransferase [Actinomadura viridis]MBG6090552.1 L-2-deoxyfucosyltransferase [Actinomadura viridis]
MRILFTTVTEKAHLYAQVPLAWALRTAGHEVRVVASPDQAEEITRTGLTAVPIGADRSAKMAEADRVRKEAWERQQEVFAEEERHGAGRDADHRAGEWQDTLDISELRPERLTYEHMHGVLTVWMTGFQGLFTESMLDDLVGFARYWRPDLVIWDPLTFGGPVAARACGAAHARLLFGMDLLGFLRQNYRAELERRPAALREDPLEEWLGWVLHHFGCGPFDEETVVGQWTIDPMPGVMRLPVDLRYVPVRHVPYNGPATVPGWLREPPKRPRVCLTLGLSEREMLGSSSAPLADLLEAVSELDVEVVATLNDDQLARIEHVPGNVRTAGFVPLNELLPTCSAIIHHGGFGTLQSALVHGVPQVIAPDRQLDNRRKTERMEQSGAALYVRDADRLSATTVRDMLTRVLEEPSFAANAARLRTELLGRPTPAGLVPVLERLTAEHRPAGAVP